MINIIKLVHERDSQAIYDYICGFIHSEDERKAVMTCIFDTPMLFDPSAYNSPIIQTHLRNAGVLCPPNEHRGYEYTVLPIAKYVMALRTYSGKAPPLYNMEQQLGDKPAATPAEIIDRVERQARNNLPKITLDAYATERGTVWKKTEYTKAIDEDMELIGEPSEYEIRDAIADRLGEEDMEETNDYYEYDDMDIDDTDINIRNVIYHAEDGRKHLLDEGDYMTSDAIIDRINEIVDDGNEEYLMEE